MSFKFYFFVTLIFQLKILIGMELDSYDKEPMINTSNLPYLHFFINSKGKSEINIVSNLMNNKFE